MSTKAQQWARKRNWQKGRIKSSLNLCMSEIYTDYEKEIMKTIKVLLDDALTHWEEHNKKSKENFLRR